MTLFPLASFFMILGTVIQTMVLYRLRKLQVSTHVGWTIAAWASLALGWVCLVVQLCRGN